MTLSILQRVGQGDRPAVRECLERYGGMVWSIARRLSPDESEAEDATQEIFIELWKKADRFDPRLAAESTFIAMIARRRLIDRHRKRTRDLEATNMGGDVHTLAAPCRGDLIEQEDEAIRVLACMERLRPIERKVLELSIYGGLSQVIIAERIGIPLGTVKTNARRGLMRLRELLQGLMQEDAP